MINMIKVNSSNIDSVGYENKSLFVTFNNNTTYKYLDVPAETYIDLLNADSKGKFFNTSIKKSGYEFQKVDNFQASSTLDKATKTIEIRT